MDIIWLGHASFKIKTLELTIYIDPYVGDYDDVADIILMTHDHYDHADANKVKQIRTDDTEIITTAKLAPRFSATVMKPGDELEVKGIKIKAVRAYNTNKFREPNVPYHPKQEDMVGFIIEIEGKTLYHAGDTDVIPEMKDIKADIALLPVGGTYTMDAKEASEAVALIKPRLAIPIHWGEIVGTKEDAEHFKELLEHTEIEVKILEPGEVISL